jgi:hypothetical protein
VLHQKIEKEKTLVTQWNNCEVFAQTKKKINKIGLGSWSSLLVWELHGTFVI